MLADLELCRVNADRDAARACRQIVASQSALPPLVELPVRCQRQRMRRNHHAFTQPLAPAHQNFPSLVSKCVGLLSVAPPSPIQSATHSIICSIVTLG